MLRCTKVTGKRRRHCVTIAPTNDYVQDTEVGTEAIGAVSISATHAVLIALTAPTSAGTYGACVEIVSGESNTDLLPGCEDHGERAGDRGRSGGRDGGRRDDRKRTRQQAVARSAAAIIPHGVCRRGPLPAWAKDRLARWRTHGQTLAAAGSVGIWLYDVATGRERTLLRAIRMRSYRSFSPDGSTLASGSRDETVVLWDVVMAHGRQPSKAIRLGSHPYCFLRWVHPRGSWDNTVILWDVVSGTRQATLQGHTNEVLSVSFSPDGSTLASGSFDETVILWDVVSGTRQATLQGHTALVLSVSFSPDGSTLASGSRDEVILWNVVSGARQATLQGHTSNVYSVSFSPDGSTLASGSWDETVDLWDVVSGTRQATLQGHTWRVLSVRFLRMGPPSPPGALTTNSLGRGQRYAAGDLPRPYI